VLGLPTQATAKIGFLSGETSIQIPQTLDSGRFDVRRFPRDAMAGHERAGPVLARLSRRTPRHHAFFRNVSSRSLNGAPVCGTPRPAPRMIARSVVNSLCLEHRVMAAGGHEFWK
jgi:hypothetical protein